MQKTVGTLVPLVTILLFLELASAKPIDYADNPELQDVIKKPVAGLPDPGIDLTSSDYADFNTPDFVNTVAPDDEKINSDKSSTLTSQPIPVEVENVAGKPGFEKPSRLPTSLKPVGPERPSSLATNFIPDSWTASSTITSLEPVSESEDANSLVTSLELGTGGPDNLVTTLEPGSLSATMNVGSGKPGSLPTTLKSDSGRRGNSETTSMPESQHPGNEVNNLPVTGESKSGASSIGSSCMMVLLGIHLLLIGSSQVG